MLAVERSALTQGVLVPGTHNTYGGLEGQTRRKYHVGNFSDLVIRQSFRCATGGAHLGCQWTYLARLTPSRIEKDARIEKAAKVPGFKRCSGHLMELGRQKKPQLIREVRLTDVSTQATRGGNTQTEEVLDQDHAALTGDKGPTKPPILFSAEAEDEPLLTSGDASESLGVSSAWQLSRGKAELVLFLVPLLWGTYGPAIKYIYENPGPPSVSILTTLRSALSVVAYAAVLPVERAQSQSQPAAEASESDSSLWRAWGFPPGTWLAGAELGFWNTVGTALQMMGLQETTATQAGFLIQTVNVLVPAILLASGQPVRKSMLVAVPLCIAGVLLLSSNESAGTAEGSVVGDAYLLASAFCYAMFTVRLGVHAQRLPALALTAAKMVVGVGLGLLWMGWDWGSSLALGGPPQPSWEGWDSPLLWGVILYSSLFPGALASLIMAVGQRTVPAAEAQIVYSTTPLFNALLSFFLLHEVLGPKGWAGGALLVAAAAVASYEKREDATKTERRVKISDADQTDDQA